MSLRHSEFSRKRHKTKSDEQRSTSCLPIFDHIDIHLEMAIRTKKVTVNLPADLIDESMQLTGTGLTSTIIEALQELKRSAKRSALRRLKGKVAFDLDLGRTRK